MNIDEYLKKAEFVKDKLVKEVDDIIRANKEEILDLNRDKQLFDLGIDGQGNRLFPLYSDFTIHYKRLLSMPFNRVTLSQTGKFYDGFDLKKQNNKITIFSTDSKSKELQDRYGKNIFGLTSDNSKKMNYEIIYPEVLIFVNKYL